MFACLKIIKEWIVFLMQPFFSNLFCNKIKIYILKKEAREALWLWMLSLSARVEEVLVLMLLSSLLSCSRDTMPPAALWLSSLNTPNLQAECTSLKLVYSKAEDVQ